MTSLEPNSERTTKLQWLAQALNFAVIVAGLTAIFSQNLRPDQASGIPWIDVWLSMHWITAASLVVMGFSLFIQSFQNSRWLGTLFAKFLALCTTTVSAIAVVHYFSDFEVDVVPLGYLGEMLMNQVLAIAPMTSVSLLILSFALITMSRRSSLLRILTQVLCLLGALASVQALATMHLKIDGQLLVGDGMPIAFMSGVALILFSVACLLSQRTHQFAQLLASRTAGGQIARRLLFMSVVIPPLLGLIVYLGAEAGWYNENYRLTLQVAANIFTFILISWIVAAALDRKDRERLKAELSLREERNQVKASNVDLEKEVEARTRELQLFQERLERTQNLALVMTLHVDLNGNWMKVPPTFCEFVGYSVEELLGQPFRNVTHPQDFEEDWRQCQRLIRGEVSSFEMEKRFLRKDGTSVWGYLNCSLVRDEMGNPVSFLSYVRNINDQKKLAQELQRQEQHLRLAIEIAELGTFDHNLITNEYIWNDRVAAIFGFRPGEYDGSQEQLFSRIHPDDRERVYFESQRASQERRELQIEYRVLWPDHSVHWVVVRSRSYLNEAGQLARMVGTVLDLTEQRRLVQEIEFEKGQFETVMTQLPVAVIIGEAPSGRLLFANSKMQQVWGHEMYPSQTIDDYRSWKGFHWDGRPYEPMDWPLARSISRGEVVTNEDTRILRGDGSHGILRLSSAPVRDRSGQIVAGVVICQDITEERRAQEDLAASELRYRLLTESVPHLVWSLRPDGMPVYFNRRWVEFTGMQVSEMIGNGWLEFVHPDDRNRVLMNRQQAIQAGQPFEYEVRLRNHQRQYLWHASRVVPLKNDRGEVLAWYGSAVNVDDQKKFTEFLKTTNEELERRVQDRTSALIVANRELEAFSYSVSHDLRAPLRSMGAFSKILLDKHAEGLDPKAQEYLQRIRGASVKLGQLIDDLLRLSQISRSEIRHDPVDLSAMAMKIASELQAQDPQRQVVFEIQPGLTTRGDQALLMQALKNLMENSWKYTSKHATARIHFGSRVEKNHTVYFVHDDGAGFNMEYSNQLFKAFQRLHNPRDFEGTGVGLATVKRIIERHGGDIWAESEVEKGATFYFTLSDRKESYATTYSLARRGQPGRRGTDLTSH